MIGTFVAGLADETCGLEKKKKKEEKGAIDRLVP